MGALHSQPPKRGRPPEQSSSPKVKPPFVVYGSPRVKRPQVSPSVTTAAESLWDLNSRDSSPSSPPSHWWGWRHQPSRGGGSGPKNFSMSPTRSAFNLHRSSYNDYPLAINHSVDDLTSEGHTLTVSSCASSSNWASEDEATDGLTCSLDW